MPSTRRSTHLSSGVNKSTTPRHVEIWSQRRSKAIVDNSDDDNEIECETESENNENCNLINKKSTREMKKSVGTPRSNKTLPPMPASKKQELLLATPNKRKSQTPARQPAALTTDDEETGLELTVRVSPPKQSRQQRTHVKHIISPTRLLDRLSIDDKPDKLKDSSSDEAEVIITENTTHDTVATPKRNKYQNARRVLNSAETNFLPGREKELKQLQDFLSEHLDNEKSGSLYVSGQPGTGKTACLSKLLHSEEFALKFTKVYINCTSISTIGSIYKKICNELQLKVQGHAERDYLAAIKKHLCATAQRRKMILLVLDEIDQLCGQKQSVLYTIFEWPALQKSRLLLVGIANSLDLTDRMLTRLNAKCDLKPRLMHFAPYTKQQIVDIFKSRLEEAGVLDVFPNVTIQLLAAKVSAISGDVRRALDIGRRVVEIAEQQKTSSAKPNINLEELGLDANDKTDELKPVQVSQVVTVLNKVYGASQRLQEDMEEAFPLQQKIMLCCLMLMLRKEKNKDITMGRLHDVYKRVCTKRNILAVGSTEFAGLVDLVETRGILRIVRKKEPRLSKVQLQWDEEEVNAALSDKQLIASILDDTECLVR